MGTGGRLKIPKITILHCFLFFIKPDSKCCNFSMDPNRVKGFSATRYLKIDLRPCLVILTPKLKRAIPPSGNPLMYFFDKCGAERDHLKKKNSNKKKKQCLGFGA
jgi:hypothetical protein